MLGCLSRGYGLATVAWIARPGGWRPRTKLYSRVALSNPNGGIPLHFETSKL